MHKEMARVLREVADQIEAGIVAGQVSDNSLWGFTCPDGGVVVELLSEEQPESE